ncbi:MAG: SGNH/GDSL hydrolase family protein [Clostridia bacterium]|nr:SGNH/GDSL hydrolase family protein [Clostridia bacterium]
MKKICKLLIYGDSIGKGVLWNEERQRYCISKNACVKSLSDALPWPVENRCVMGNTVKRCLEEFKHEKAEKGAVAVFELGSNDCDMPWKAISEAPDHEYEAKVPLHEFYRDLRELIHLAKRRRMTPIVTVPIPLDGEKYLDWVSRDNDRAGILRYLGDPVQMARWQERWATAVRDVARQEKVKVIDLRDFILRNRQFKDLYCADGIHLNDRGQKYLFDCLKEQGYIPEPRKERAPKKARENVQAVCTAL